MAVESSKPGRVLTTRELIQAAPSRRVRPCRDSVASRRPAWRIRPVQWRLLVGTRSEHWGWRVLGGTASDARTIRVSYAVRPSVRRVRTGVWTADFTIGRPQGPCCLMSIPPGRLWRFPADALLGYGFCLARK